MGASHPFLSPIRSGHAPPHSWHNWVDAQLIEQAKEYADLHDTSVSRLVELYFHNLVAQEGEGQHTPLVQALTGLLPSELDAEAEYRKHLADKYGA